jgi:hypothetical protein
MIYIGENTMNNDLIKHLMNKGMSEADALSIAQDFNPESVNVDDLTNALDGLSKAMKMNEQDQMKSKKAKTQGSLFEKGDEDGSSSEDGSSYDDEDEDEEDEDEDDDKMEKAMKEMAKGTDAILDAMDKQYKAMMKAVEACTKELKAMKENGSGKMQQMEKSLSRALLEPVAPTSINFNKIPYVEQTKTPAFTTQDVMNKALSLVKTENDWSRKAELTSAISRLSAGVNPQDIIAEYNINMSK